MKLNRAIEGVSICSSNKSDLIRIEFLNSLFTDLRLAGYQITIRNETDQIHYLFSIIDPLSRTPLEISSIYKAIKNRELASEYEFIRSMEANGVFQHFIDGDKVNPYAIKPKLVFCKSPNEFKLVKYCRLLQSVPNSLGVGRRFSVLVYDTGQNESPILMGLLCFSDATISLHDRDIYLNWTDKNIKRHGLRMVLQLSVCMALPPYHWLFGAKLIAGLALSTPVQQEFNDRYGVPLLGVFTTSATGFHNAIFNRIKLNGFVNKSLPSNYHSEMYKRIGKTSSRTLSVISNQTVNIAKKLVFCSDGNNSKGLSKSSFRNQKSKNRIVYEALRTCGLSRDILNLNEKGLYFGSLNPQNVNILRNPDLLDRVRPITELDVGVFTNYWINHWASKAITNKARSNGIQEFKNYQIHLFDNNHSII